jgi:pimeloyl-ACP methyl ester carboxylesterase
MKKLFLLMMLAITFTSAIAQTSYPFQVRITGKGKQSIIFIPGFSCSGEVWNETVQHFSPHYKCYVLTMPGFAGVPAEAAPDIKSWVKYIADYIKNEKIEKPVLIGHSLGGVMSQWIAAEYPSLISKIVIVDALPCLPALSDPSFSVKQSPDCSAYTESYKTMSDQQFAQMQKRSMASLVADTSKITPTAEWGIRSDRNTLGLLFCQLMNTDMRPKLPSITCPSLVMLESNFKGIHDQIEEQYKDLKGAKLVYASRGLHFIMYDDKDWYLAQLEEFLK